MGGVSVADNPTTNLFRPAPGTGMLHAGSKGVAVYKLTCCVAAAVAGLGGAAAADKHGRWRRAKVKWEMSDQ